MADDEVQADRDLQIAFEQSLRGLTRENKRSLNEAGNAWLTFARANWIAWAADDREGIPASLKTNIQLRELQQRRAHLQSFFLIFKYPYDDSVDVRDRLNAELESVYSSCLKVLSPDAQNQLRAAQRAWIVYRDLDADAAVVVARQYNRPLFRGFAAKSDLIAIRTSQLREAYLGRNPAPPRPEAPPAPQPPTTPNPSPAELAPVELLRKEAQSFLRDLVAARRESFFTKPGSFKQLTPFEGPTLTKIADLDSRVDIILRRTPSFGGRIMGEAQAIGVLLRWGEFSAGLNEGDPEKAARVMPGVKSAVLGEYPEILNPIDEWEQLFVKSLATYRAHMKRAESLADLGKSSEAMREYNAAFEIFENPRIPKAVKRLREQSLGL